MERSKCINYNLMNMNSAASVTVQESAGILNPEVFLRNGCGPAQECPSIPLEEVGEEAIGEMYSWNMLKYANPETQRIGCRIETLTDSSCIRPTRHFKDSPFCDNQDKKRWKRICPIKEHESYQILFSILPLNFRATAECVSFLALKVA